MKVLIGMPCMGTIQMETVGSMVSLQKTFPDIDFEHYVIENSLVYDARNSIINYARQIQADYLLFVDSDIVFPCQAFKTLLDMNKGIVSGVYYSRSEYVHSAIIYDQIKPRRIFRRQPKVRALNRKLQGCEKVKACGMGFCLIRKDVLDKMSKFFRCPFEPYKGLGEDISFCYKASKIGIPTYAVECGIGHKGTKIYRG